jgi:hypothetical protein
MSRAAVASLGFCLATLMAQAALAQTLGQAVSPAVPWWRVVGALVVCLGLAAGGAFALRSRLGLVAGLRLPLAGADQRRLRLVETVRLSHQIDVCLLRFDERDLLVAATPHGAVLLSDRDQPAPAQKP